MSTESFEERLRAYLDRLTRRTAGPGAVDRVMAAAFAGPVRNQGRRLLATIAIAVAAALVVATPITVLLLNQTHHNNTPPPATRQSATPSSHATSVPTATVAPSGPPHVNLAPNGAAFWDSQRGLLVATPACNSSTGICPGGLIERTIDGGKTWQIVDRVAAGLTGVALGGGGVAWVSEAGGSGCGNGAGSCPASTLLITADGGTKWTAVSSLTPVLSVSPVSTTTAWAVAGPPEVTGPGMTLVRSGDGGRIWQQRGDPCSKFGGLAPWAVSFAGSARGWLVCAGGPATDMQPKAVFATYDGGATWQLESDTCASLVSGQPARNLGSLSCVGYYPSMSFLSDGRGRMYLERGALSTTSDSGRTWTQISANIVTDDVNSAIALSIVNDTKGLILITHSEADPVCPAAGCGPELLTTNDAGRTWIVVASWVV